MIIFYHIKPDTGTVLLEYGDSTESQVVQDFIAHEGIPSYNTISVDVQGDQSYMSEDAYLDLAKHLWLEFGDIPTNEAGVDGQIEQAFLHFKAGTDVQDVWRWFESEFSVSVAEDLMYGKMKS